MNHLEKIFLIFFSFFLEKNMLSYFLYIMRQKSGGPSFVCVQLLQTLNILFENIRNETSLCKSTIQIETLIVYDAMFTSLFRLFVK